MIIKGFNINMDGKRTIDGRKLTNENLTEMGNDVMENKYVIVYENFEENGEVEVGVIQPLFDTYEEAKKTLLDNTYSQDGFEGNEFFVLEHYDDNGVMASYVTANIHKVVVED